MTAHAPVLQSRFHHSQAPHPGSALFHSCQRWHLFGLQLGSFARWSAHPVLLCFHSAPTLPKSLGNTKGQEEGRRGNLACFVSANPVHRNTPLSPFKRKQLTYISCTSHSVHLNELGVHCIDDSVHFFVPLPY